MINFFRRIRKKMADDNKPLKYTRYAIGEIILVVIGILIALQINNWNEERKNHGTQIGFIRGLLLNVDDDIVAINSSINRNYEKMEAITQISNRFYQPLDMRNDSILKAYFITMWGAEFFSNQSSVFDGIKSSGKLNLIRSDELLFQILSYYHNSGEISREQEINNANIEGLIYDPVFRDKVDMDAIIEPLFDSIIRSETGEFDTSFFDKEPNSSEVKNFRNSLSAIKGNYGTNSALLFGLRRQAIALKDALGKYLRANGMIKLASGHPKVLVQGKSAHHEIEIQDAVSRTNWIEYDTGQINIRYPSGVVYGVIRFIDKDIKVYNAISSDYTSYESISLELKGAVGGEEILITFLDTDDAADGSEIKSTFILTDQWETYEVSLDQFPNTNFASLIESPVLVLQQEAVSFSIKNIEFKE